MDFLHSLRNPQLVANFQRLCGVYFAPAPVDSRPQGGPKTNGHVTTAEGKANGLQNGNGAIGGVSKQANGSHKELGERDFVVKSTFLYYLFSIGAELGNEMFYCIFFPYWFWNVDGYVCRRLILVWCMVMYVGQAAKDVIRWPRPISPPVVRMEARYVLEYGMPSTHAMIGLAFPLSLLLFTYNRYVYPTELAVCAAVVWCICVCLSRLYLGMHSVADVVVGLVSVSAMLPLIYSIIDSVDEFQLTHAYAPLIMVCATLLAAFLYPKLDKWSTCRGDTLLLLGVAAGVAIASWLNYQENYIPHNRELVGDPPYVIKTPDMKWVKEACLRMLIGYFLLFAARVVMKVGSYEAAVVIFGLDRKRASENKRMFCVEMCQKYLCYVVIAFCVVFVAPSVFRHFDIERPTAWTEV